MIKLFSNGCEGTTQLKAEPFKPTAVLEDFVNLMNMLYDGQGNLFEIKKYKDETISLIGSTNLLSAATDWEVGEFDLDSFQQIIDGLRSSYGEAVDLVKNGVLAQDPGTIALGEFLAPLIAPSQKVVVQLTDLEHGNTEFIIET